MKVVTESEVTCCRDCPYVTNSSREHDDPFTSAPLNPSWWCTRDDGPDFIYSKEVDKKIHKDCPLK